MRQRGPTATALSPGLYLDGHPARVLTNTVATPCANNITPRTPPPDVYATTIPSKLATISPVLSRIQSPLPVLLDNNMTSNLKQKQVAVSRTSSVQPQSKLHRKHHKNRRIGLHQINGDVGRNLHSLKVTIRRTSQSHKIDSAQIDTHNVRGPEVRNSPQSGHDIRFPLGSTVTCDAHPHALDHNITIQPLDIQRVCSSPCTSGISTPIYPSERTSSANGKVDASTSTLDRSTLTEPDILGPCEPGTKVVVEGVVWLETAGMLVLNVQWRGRSYVGTLLDASRQSFGPTCMDKGITSALSLLDGRRAWSYSPSGRFRSRAMHHHFHHHHHHHRSIHHRHSNASGGAAGAMTTRAAAAAAAAAASASSTQNTDHESPEPSVDVPSCTRFPAQEFASRETFASCRPQRGGKRRRRRGAASNRPYRRIPPRNAPASLIDPTSSSLQNTPNSSRLGELDELSAQTEIEGPSNASGSTNEQHSSTFTCPYPECKKTFDDLVSMRYHFSLGHAANNGNLIKPEPHQTKTIIEKHSHVVEETNAPGSELICVDDPGPTSSPPPLGQAHEQVNASQEEIIEPMVTEDGFDNLEPPRLHRIVSITDSTNGLSQGVNSSSSKVGEANDEPPAPSPAYSDISDDGTVPADQSVLFVDNYNPQLMTKLTPSVRPALLSPSATAFPAHSPRLSVDPALAISMAASPTTPLSSDSPSVRHHPPNSAGFYFPLSLLSPTRATLESGLLTPSSTAFVANSVISNHHHHNNGGSANSNNCPSRANTSLNLDTDKMRDRRIPQIPSLQPTCTVNSQPCLSNNNFQPRGDNVNILHIPGVNSFSPLPHELATSMGSDTLNSVHHNPVTIKECPLLPSTVLQSIEPSIRWCLAGSPPMMNNRPTPMFTASGPLNVPPSQGPSRVNVQNTTQSFPLHSTSLRPPFSESAISSNHLASFSSRFPFVHRSK